MMIESAHFIWRTKGVVMQKIELQIFLLVLVIFSVGWILPNIMG
jgi:hypothetical protein